MRHFKRRQLRRLSRMALAGHVLRVHKAKRLHKLQRKHVIRLETGLAGLILLSSVLLQTYFSLNPANVRLDPKYHALVGDSRDDTAQYLTKNKDGNSFDFAVPASTDTATKEHTGRVADAYSASLSIYARDGVSVTDTASKVAVTIKPQFATALGQKVDGDHIVYSLGSTKLVYTLKYNGLKEDIILPEAPKAGQASFVFTMTLPSGVEARLDDQGNIGIYSADPTLFGNISFGSDQDREKVDKARENGDKNNLVMTIPFPIVKDSTGQEYSDRASFKLGKKQAKQIKQADKNLPAGAPTSLTTTNNYDLTIQAKNLKDLNYPISVDPTMQVTSSGDFAGTNAEGGTSIDATNNLIKRTSLTGGTICTIVSGSCTMSGWANTGSNLDAVAAHGLAVYNGFIYAVGYASSLAPQNKLQYAPISTNGTIGTWNSTTTTLTSSRGAAGVAIYNGYLYVYGGLTSFINRTNLVEYIKIDSTGDITGSWSTASNTGFASRYYHASFVASGYLYAIGGCTNNTTGCPGSKSNETLYAKINPDGSLASDSDGAGSCTTTWCQTITIATATSAITAAYYGGYVYLCGGGSGVVQYARVNSDGTLSGASGGTWLTTTSYPAASLQWPSMVAEGGYVYILGGIATGSTRVQTYYAPMNADGTLGTWQHMTDLNVGQQDAAAIAYNGYLVIVGGTSGGGPITVSEKAQISPAGSLDANAWCTNTTSPCGATSYSGSARYGAAVVAYDGYLYLIGGCYNNIANCASTSAVDYVAVNADGTLGAWQSSSATGLGTMAYLSAVAYDGYLYVISGCTSGANDQCGGGANSSYSSAINASTGAPGNWSAEAGLPTNYAHEKAFSYGNKLYFTGGCTPNDFTSQAAFCQNPKIAKKTYVATMNNGAAAGSRLGGGFTDTGRDLPVETAAYGLATYGNYVYVAGGWTGSAKTANVYYSSFDASGNLQTWQSAGNNLPTAIMGHGLAASNGYLYSYGGCTSVATNPFDNCSGGATTTVNMAKINSGGTIGSWQTTQPMAAARDRFGGVAVGGVLYAVAGTNAGNTSTYLSTSTYQSINNGGSGKLASWTAGSTSSGTFGYPQARHSHSAVANNGYLYMIGGCNQANAWCGNPKINIQYTVINGDGSLGAWNPTTASAPDGDTYGGQSSVAYGGYLYVTGGKKSGTVTNTTWSIAFQANGNITGSWNQLTGSSLPSARWHLASAMYGNNWYVAGGDDDNATMYNTVSKATLGAGGTLSAWTTTSGGQNFSTPRWGAALAVSNDYAYIYTGCSNLEPLRKCIGGMLSDVQYSHLDSSGNITTWVTSPNVVPFGAFASSYAVMDGYLYTISGYSNDATGSDIEVRSAYAPLLPNGDVGSWQLAGKDASGQLNVSRVYGTAVVYNGKIYITGGCTPTASTAQQSADYTSFQSIPRTGSFSKLYDFGVGVKPTKLITRGTKQSGATVSFSYMNNNNMGGTFGSTSTTSDISYGGSGALGIALGGNVTLSRYLFIRYSIDDTYSAVFPDNGNESTITDFDLYYTANPARRLRNGRTFTGGNDGKPADRGLQASPQ